MRSRVYLQTNQPLELASLTSMDLARQTKTWVYAAALLLHIRKRGLRQTDLAAGDILTNLLPFADRRHTNGPLPAFVFVLAAFAVG